MLATEVAKVFQLDAVMTCPKLSLVISKTKTLFELFPIDLILDWLQSPKRGRGNEMKIYFCNLSLHGENDHLTAQPSAMLFDQVADRLVAVGIMLIQQNIYLINLH